MDEPPGDARRAQVGRGAAGEHAQPDETAVARIARPPERILSLGEGVEKLVMREGAAVQKRAFRAGNRGRL